MSEIKFTDKKQQGRQQEVCRSEYNFQSVLEMVIGLNEGSRRRHYYWFESN